MIPWYDLRRPRRRAATASWPGVVYGPAEGEAPVQQVAREADAEQEDDQPELARRPGDGRADDEDEHRVHDVREFPAGVEPGLFHIPPPACHGEAIPRFLIGEMAAI